jgi:hypothetical protein
MPMKRNAHGLDLALAVGKAEEAFVGATIFVYATQSFDRTAAGRSQRRIK